MFDNWDPYQTLKDHDDWIATMAKNQEILAEQTAKNAVIVEQQVKLIRQLVRGYEHMVQKNRYLEERIYNLENPQ